MHFKKLEIFGFKSFADKTTLEFGEGITAIIGPNGCGKSNIFDAVRWVLGEQSVKELRGSSMEDVIFNGTDKKPALGFAEVSLTFSNESKLLPVDYNEVTITRRLYRSGESEYLINKATVRLKDVVELFMGTGIGAEAYSLVQQGKVDLVVSAKPEERRIIFDEASGITKYKAKKKEALSKLKDTENNLLRINDIIIEVKRQISSLERQASKARRYKGEFEKLKHLEVRTANFKLERFAEERRNVKTHLEELRNKEEQLVLELKEFNSRLEHENEHLEELEDKANGIKAEDIKLEGQVDINNRQIGFNEERIENISLNEKRITEHKDQLINKCRQQQEQVDKFKQLLELIALTAEGNKRELDGKKKQLESIANDIQDSKGSIVQEEAKIIDITANQVRIKNRLTESMKEVQTCLARKRRLEIESSKVFQEKEEVEQRLNEISHKTNNTSQVIFQLQGELDSKNICLRQLTESLSVLEKEVDELEKKKFFFKSQKEFIEKLSVQYEGMPDPVIEGHLFTHTPPLEHHTGLIGKVKSFKKAESWSLGSIKNLFNGNSEELYELICETKFIELDPQQMAARIEELSKEIGEMILRKEDLIAKVEEQRMLVSKVSREIQEKEKVLSILEAQKCDITGDVNKLNEELELVNIELSEVEQSLASVKKEEEGFAHEMDYLTQDLEQCQLSIKEKQERISFKAQEREETTVSIAQLETEIISIEDKKRDYQDNLKMFTGEIDSSLEEIKRIEDEFLELKIRKDKFRQEIESLRENIIDLKDQRQALQGTLLSFEKQKDEVAQRIHTLQNNITSYSSDIEEIKSSVHARQFNEQEIVFKEKEIKDRLQQTYKIDLESYNRGTVLEESLKDEALPAEGTEGGEEIFDEEAMVIAIDRLRKRCDSFGSVNLVAIEEFDELKERFEFLTKQQSDLITSKESLHNTISKINRQTKQMFMDTFTRVSEEFRIYFRMLFGGGEAQLILLDPENVLESGVEIVARPPGKKLQNISLLSGGEKTLTAIALVFGVFKVNPSPFCVLDEIDAALDESNVGRYSYLLKDFAKIAQFIVITHNKKTIQSAKVIYGITMQETGVSKLVSVKFGEHEEVKEESSTVEISV